MPSTRRPNTSISPDDFTNPEIAFMRVVLPAPLVPMRPTTSPGSHLDRHVVDRGAAAEADLHVAR